MAKKLNVFAFASDRGGAEQLLHLIKQSHWSFQLELEGLAEIIAFELGMLEKSRRLSSVDMFIFSTGFENKQYLKMCLDFKQRGIPTVCLLESFDNYRERFILNGRLCTSERFLVNSQLQVNKLMKEVNSNVKVEIVPNFYLKDLKKKFKKNNSSLINCGLILADPFDSSDYKLKKFTSLELEYYNLSYRFLVEQKKCDKVLFRMHPSDNPEKFDSLKIKKELEKDKNINFLDTLKNVDVCVGYKTNALEISSVLDIETISLRMKSQNKAVFVNLNIKDFHLN